MAFDLESYLREKESTRRPSRQERNADAQSFPRLCERVRDAFQREWESGGSAAALQLQKNAIIGMRREKEFFKQRISELLRQFEAEETTFPGWYESLSDAVYHENWGLAGLAEWFSECYAQSSSAKIIGERIYFMDEGRMKLMPQTLPPERFEQLIRAFLLLTPEERMDKSYYELYLLDGTRVTIFTEPMAKKGQPGIVFRRYLIPRLSFEEQARRGTIPEDSVPFFKAMARMGYNVVFMGAVRTAKTTFLSTWQSLEDPTLEGVMVETDPEIAMHRILPKAPILQLIADGEELRTLSKSLLRSDADYFILAEARDGIALDTAVRIAAKGTKRMKLTFHSRRPDRFPLEAATEIVKATGGDLQLTMQMVAGAFDFLFHFVQLKDKSQKRLKGIYHMNCGEDGSIAIVPFCRYDPQKGSWRFEEEIGEAQRLYGEESDPEGFRVMMKLLGELSRAGEIR